MHVQCALRAIRMRKPNENEKRKTKNANNDLPRGLIALSLSNCRPCCVCCGCLVFAIQCIPACVIFDPTRIVQPTSKVPDLFEQPSRLLAIDRDLYQSWKSLWHCHNLWLVPHQLPVSLCLLVGRQDGSDAVRNHTCRAHGVVRAPGGDRRLDLPCLRRRREAHRILAVHASSPERSCCRTVAMRKRRLRQLKGLDAGAAACG